jgi:hypothetical protein
MKKLLITTTAIAIVFAACKTKQPTTSVQPKKECKYTYTVDIKPIMEQYCVKCHGSAGGYDLKNFDDVSRSAKNGSLVGTIKWQSGFPKMPARSAQLDSATITKIECWVEAGAKQ